MTADLYVTGKSYDPARMQYIVDDLELAECDGTVPRREYELMEFYKKVLDNYIVVAVEFDVEEHILSFHVKKKGE